MADDISSGRPLPRGFQPREPSREQSERPKQWAPPDVLPTPNPEEGYDFHWVRVSTLGQDDPMNISSKLREGWEPVKASDHPEIKMLGYGQSRIPNTIETGGLLLCKAPKELIAQRNAYYQAQASAQMTSVDNNYMRENDERMPLFNQRKTSVSFGRGS